MILTESRLELNLETQQFQHLLATPISKKKNPKLTRKKIQAVADEK
jgi:hypothetical protein